MRNLEKGLLLCELINFESTSVEDVQKFVAWIREQEVYISLLENIKTLKTSTSFYARYLYNEFISLNLNQIKTIEEGFVAYSKILYLHQIVTPGFYINPLLVINKQERNFSLGKIIVKYDEKFVTFEEFCKDKGTSYIQKYEFITNQVRKYQKDIREKILRPINKMSINPRNLPKLDIVPFSLLILGMFYFGTLAFLMGVSLTTIQARDFFYSFNFDVYTGANYIFFVTLFFVLIGILSFIVMVIFRSIRYHKYIKYHKIIFQDNRKVIDIINNSTAKLESHLVKALDKPELLDVKVFDFSSCYNLFEYVIYLYETNYRSMKFKVFKIKTLGRLNLTFTILFLILFLVMFFVK